MAQQMPLHRGRYRIVEAVGRWTVNPVFKGELYHARDETLYKDVLLKTVSPAENDGGSAHPSMDVARNRFAREAKITARLSHPNIINIQEVGDHEGMPFLVFEWLKGKSLLEVMNAGVALNAGLPMIVQVLNGLLHVHQSGIVHRDIKPANIFIQDHGSVKIMNFGVALWTGQTMTGTGSVVGTPSYMSPEQAQGEKVEGRCDLFSVGCVLYEMVTGKQPFRSDSTEATLFKVVRDDPEMDLIPVGPEWNRLRAVVTCALEKKPEDRYPDAGAMRADLELAIKELGQSADWTPPRSGSPAPQPV